MNESPELAISQGEIRKMSLKKDRDPGIPLTNICAEKQRTYINYHILFCSHSNVLLFFRGQNGRRETSNELHQHRFQGLPRDP